MEGRQIDAKELLEIIGAEDEEQQKVIDDFISDLDQATHEQF